MVKFIFIALERKMYSILALTENTRFTILPYELLFHIISFNEKGAIELIQKKAKMMLKNKIKVLQEMLMFGFESKLGVSLANYNIFYNNRILSKEEVIQTFNNCDCCERHKINRPKKLAPWVDTTISYRQDVNCHCRCRQFSRFICREIM